MFIHHKIVNAKCCLAKGQMMQLQGKICTILHRCEKNYLKITNTYFIIPGVGDLNIYICFKVSIDTKQYFQLISKVWMEFV